jgi:hypothetical protein
MLCIASHNRLRFLFFLDEVTQVFQIVFLKINYTPESILASLASKCGKRNKFDDREYVVKVDQNSKDN